MPAPTGIESQNSGRLSHVWISKSEILHNCVGVRVLWIFKLLHYLGTCLGFPYCAEPETSSIHKWDFYILEDLFSKLSKTTGCYSRSTRFQRWSSLPLSHSHLPSSEWRRPLSQASLASLACGYPSVPTQRCLSQSFMPGRGTLDASATHSAVVPALLQNAPS